MFFPAGEPICQHSIEFNATVASFCNSARKVGRFLKRSTLIFIDNNSISGSFSNFFVHNDLEVGFFVFLRVAWILIFFVKCICFVFFCPQLLSSWHLHKIKSNVATITAENFTVLPKCHVFRRFFYCSNVYFTLI